MPVSRDNPSMAAFAAQQTAEAPVVEEGDIPGDPNVTPPAVGPVSAFAPVKPDGLDLRGGGKPSSGGGSGGTNSLLPNSSADMGDGNFGPVDKQRIDQFLKLAAGNPAIKACVDQFKALLKSNPPAAEHILNEWIETGKFPGLPPPDTNEPQGLIGEGDGYLTGSGSGNTGSGNIQEGTSAFSGSDDSYGFSEGNSFVSGSGSTPAYVGGSNDPRSQAVSNMGLGDPNIDVEAAAIVVLMATIKDQQLDLKMDMANVQAMTKAKQKQRDLITKISKDVAANASRKSDDKSPLTKPADGLLSDPNAGGYTHTLQPSPNPLTEGGVDMIEKPIWDKEPETIDDLKGALDAAKQGLDSMNEISEMNSLHLQMTMDRLTKVTTLLSNILKKIQTTDESIIHNFV